MKTLYIEKNASNFILTNAEGVRQFPRQSWRTERAAHNYATTHGFNAVCFS